MNAGELKAALESKSLTAVTKAIGRIAENLGYQLKPPYTEVLHFTSNEEDEDYSVHFEARLRLHYCKPDEGFVFVIEFRGDALSDTPTPLLHDLFYAAVVEVVEVYGYGFQWKGKSVVTPQEFTQQLEVTLPTVNRIELNEFYDILQGVR
jgi:hypothetical protein